MFLPLFYKFEISKMCASSKPEKDYAMIVLSLYVLKICMARMASAHLWKRITRSSLGILHSKDSHFDAKKLFEITFRGALVMFFNDFSTL